MNYALPNTKPWRWSCHRKRMQVNWASGGHSKSVDNIPINCCPFPALGHHPLPNFHNFKYSGKKKDGTTAVIIQ